MAELMTISQCPAQLSGTRRVRMTHVRLVAQPEARTQTGLNMNPSDLRCGVSIVGAMSLISRVEDLRRISKMLSERCGNAMLGKSTQRISFSLKLPLWLTVPRSFG